MNYPKVSILLKKKKLSMYLWSSSLSPLSSYLHFVIYYDYAMMMCFLSFFLCFQMIHKDNFRLPVLSSCVYSLGVQEVHKANSRGQSAVSYNPGQPMTTSPDWHNCTWETIPSRVFTEHLAPGLTLTLRVSCAASCQFPWVSSAHVLTISITLSPTLI